MLFLPPLILFSGLAGCGGGDDSSHHYGDRTDPLNECTECHGANLSGGRGPSCYNCHDNDDHTVDRSGVMHGGNDGCESCHGPDRTGGIGPACTLCHAEQP